MDGREVDAWDVRIPLGPPYQPVHHTLPTLTEALAWADAQLRADGWVFESADPGESGRSTAERVAQVREAHAALARAVEDLLAELDAPRVSAEPSAEEQTP